MGKSQVAECSDEAILRDLLQANYIEEVKKEKSQIEVKPQKELKANGGKRNYK